MLEVLYISALMYVHFFLGTLLIYQLYFTFNYDIKVDPNNSLGSNWSETENICNRVGVSCRVSRQIVR